MNFSLEVRVLSLAVFIFDERDPLLQVLLSRYSV